MKKSLILILAAVCSAVSLKAQTQKGNQLLGGNFGFSTTSSNTVNNPVGAYNPPADSKTKTTNWGIGPTYSYFIADKLDFGVSAVYSNSKQSITYTNPAYTSPQDNKLESISATLYLRKYLLYKDKIGFRAGPYAAYGYSNSKSPQSYYTYQNQRFFEGGVGLDLVFFPTKRLGLASGLGAVSYSHQRSRSNGYVTNSSGFALSLVSNLNLGVFYSFGK